MADVVKQTTHYDDLRYLVEVEMDRDPAKRLGLVVRIWGIGNAAKPRLYVGRHQTADCDWTVVEPLYRAFVKYDGCLNLSHDEGCLHFCSREEAKRFGDLLVRLFDLARELMPFFEG